MKAILPPNLSPTISVCIPTYCGAAHLGEAIESVLNQSFTDYELIIIDDNSPDQTAELMIIHPTKLLKLFQAIKIIEFVTSKIWLILGQKAIGINV
ncbi:MAG: hypothetical protein RIQ94_3346 [Pseudomonadota bacterium]